MRTSVMSTRRRRGSARSSRARCRRPSPARARCDRGSTRIRRSPSSCPRGRPPRADPPAHSHPDATSISHCPSESLGLDPRTPDARARPASRRPPRRTAVGPHTNTVGWSATAMVTSRASPSSAARPTREYDEGDLRARSSSSAKNRSSGVFTEYSSRMSTVARGFAMRPQHRDHRHDTGSAGDQLHRPLIGRLPDEPAAERSAHLELVAVAQLIDEVRAAPRRPAAGRRRAAPASPARWMRSSTTARPGSRPGR